MVVSRDRGIRLCHGVTCESGRYALSVAITSVGHWIAPTSALTSILARLRRKPIMVEVWLAPMNAVHHAFATAGISGPIRASMVIAAQSLAPRSSIWRAQLSPFGAVAGPPQRTRLLTRS